jgi:hypothetical protein
MSESWKQKYFQLFRTGNNRTELINAKVKNNIIAEDIRWNQHRINEIEIYPGDRYHKSLQIASIKKDTASLESRRIVNTFIIELLEGKFKNEQEADDAYAAAIAASQAVDLYGRGTRVEDEVLDQLQWIPSPKVFRTSYQEPHRDTGEAFMKRLKITKGRTKSEFKAARRALGPTEEAPLLYTLPTIPEHGAASTELDLDDENYAVSNDPATDVAKEQKYASNDNVVPIGTIDPIISVSGLSPRGNTSGYGRQASANWNEDVDVDIVNSDNMLVHAQSAGDGDIKAPIQATFTEVAPALPPRPKRRPPPLPPRLEKKRPPPLPPRPRVQPPPLVVQESKGPQMNVHEDKQMALVRELVADIQAEAEEKERRAHAKRKEASDERKEEIKRKKLKKEKIKASIRRVSQQPVNVPVSNPSIVNVPVALPATASTITVAMKKKIKQVERGEIKEIKWSRKTGSFSQFWPGHPYQIKIEVVDGKTETFSSVADAFWGTFIASVRPRLFTAYINMNERDRLDQTGKGQTGGRKIMLSLFKSVDKYADRTAENHWREIAKRAKEQKGQVVIELFKNIIQEAINQNPEFSYLLSQTKRLPISGTKSLDVVPFSDKTTVSSLLESIRETMQV